MWQFLGAMPKWLIVNLLLPNGTTEEDLNSVMRELNAECKKYGTSIIGGHTGVYSTTRNFTATTTAIGIVKKDELRLPLAKPGDDIVITKGIAIEFAVGAAWFRAEELKKILSPSQISSLQEMYTLETVVKDASLAKKFARGMHDVTEGGLTTLHEIADNSEVGFEVYYEKLHMPPLVKKVVKFYGVNALTVSSTGTLIIISPQENTSKLIKVLHSHGINASTVGKFTEEKERILIKKAEKKTFQSLRKMHMQKCIDHFILYLKSAAIPPKALSFSPPSCSELTIKTSPRVPLTNSIICSILSLYSPFMSSSITRSVSIAP